MTGALRDNDPDMPDLDVREVALEPDAPVLRVLFTHGATPAHCSLSGSTPTCGGSHRHRVSPGARRTRTEWLSLLPHMFIGEFWTHRFCRITDDVTWFETFPPEGPGPYSGWPT